ncbi:MAG: GAF domain-containing protein [Nitrospirae bacterium]|nr:GAF domain-containing protein [Nitrospirota bacterium]
MMQEQLPDSLIQKIAVFNRTENIRIGVVGPNRRPAFGTDITIPEEIFSAQKEHYLKDGHELVLFKPLINSKTCHGCHNPNDKTRGMIVIKTSMAEAEEQVSSTAKRLLIFALFLGLTAEVFLAFVLKKMILKPLDILHKGAKTLRAGILDHRIEIRTGDELEELSSAFNQMAASLERSHDHLERAVRQKTTELRVVAELSTEVFKGDLTIGGIIEQFLDAITKEMGFGYASLCLVDRETGLLSNEYKKGTENGFCAMEISLASEHPFVRTIRDARASIKKNTEINAPEGFSNVAIIPLLSHQRKRCREINLCQYENCPAYDNADERCWLVQDTLCRSPQSVAGREKIFGCLHCPAFPVLGVLIAGKNEDIAESSLHSLEILSSEISSAIENHRFIKSKKEDISSLLALHDVSIEKSSTLSMTELTKAIVTSSTAFAGMNTAILWLKKEEELHLESAYSVDCSPSDICCDACEKDLIPDVLPLNGSLPGRSITEERAIETVRPGDVKCLNGLIRSHDFRYAAAIPLKFKGTVYGCLTLFKKKDFFMTDSEKAVILLFAGQAAAAIYTAKLYEALKTERDFSDSIFNCAASGIMVLDKEGRVLKLNLMGAGILWTDTEALIGRKITDIHPKAEEMLSYGLGMGREITLSLPNGTSIPVGFTSSPLYGSEDDEEGSIILFRDLSEIKRLQAEVRKKEHFETMGKLISGVAHEVRNPLFGISSIGQILERELESPQHRALIQAMLKEANRMKRLIEELLLYTRPSRLEIKEIDLSILVDELKYYSATKKPSIGLTMNIHPLLSVSVDRDKIMQVFLNVLNNALEAAGTSVRMSARNIGGFVEVRLTDDGPGIPAENLERIFEPFFTTKKGGTGLGLPICKKIIEDHGGSLAVESTDAMGTTIILTVPGRTLSLS